MKNKIVILASVFAVLICICYIMISYSFRPFKPLPFSELVAESVSPDGTYIVKMYYSEPALSAGTLWCEFIIENKKPKVFYMEYRASTHEIDWDDDDTVIINGMRLKLPISYYKGEFD